MRQIYQVKVLVFIASLGMMFTGCRSEDNEQFQPRLSPPPAHVDPPKPKVKLTGVFVDNQSKSITPDGKTWASAFKTIEDAIDKAEGRDIVIAAGTYKSIFLDLKDKKDLRFIGGYKRGEEYEKPRKTFADDEWVIFDGEGKAQPLVRISGSAENIDFVGGFTFQNAGLAALQIRGSDAANPVKNISVVNCKFINNRDATGGGAGIRIRFAQGVTLDRLDAEGNRAKLGGFLAAQSVNRLNIYYGEWRKNTAKNKGGAAYLSQIENLKFIGQKLVESSAEVGGAVYLNNLSNMAIIEDLTFEENASTLLRSRKSSGGGALFIDNCKNGLSLANISFVNNRAKGYGGALFIENSEKIYMRLKSAPISGNESTKKAGGAIYLAGSSDIEIRGGEFSKNTAAEMGGAIAATGLGNSLINGSRFVENTSNTQGGHISIVNPQAGEMRIIDSHFEGGVANQSAGAFFFDAKEVVGAKLSIKNSTFSKNNSLRSGGALVAYHVADQVKIDDTEFNGNKSQNFGGALALDGRNVNARFVLGQGTKFIRNQAKRKAGGGAIFAVFNPANNPSTEQLVFENIIADVESNSVEAGNEGKFLRITSHKLFSSRAPDENPAGRNKAFPYGTKVIHKFLKITDNAATGVISLGNLDINPTEPEYVYIW